MKRLSIPVLSVCLTAFAAQAATTACFMPDEAKAAHLRILQQEFNVAALNCRTLDPNDPSFPGRYNEFIGKFGAKLQENAIALRRHFSRAGGSLDIWMTKVANDAGQRVVIDIGYCQQAWENLEKVLALEPPEIEGFAAAAGAAQANVPSCESAKPKDPKAKKSATAKDKTAAAASGQTLR